jgi:hypothetical protein
LRSGRIGGRYTVAATFDRFHSAGASSVSVFRSGAIAMMSNPRDEPGNGDPSGLKNVTALCPVTSALSASVMTFPAT